MSAGRSWRALLCAAGLVLVTVAGSGPAAEAAPAGSQAVPARAVPASSGACQDPSGVTVVVDFGAFGGGVHVRCAGWPVSDGYDALRKAGFSITDTTRFPGLLCRIDGLPGDQACVVAPPSDAHWGYSHAPRGGSWTYSSQGARARDVKAGDVEGWAFGKAARSSIAPPPPPATTTAPPATSPPSTAPPATTAPGGVAPPPAPSPAGPSAAPSSTVAGGPAAPEAEGPGAEGPSSADDGDPTSEDGAVADEDDAAPGSDHQEMAAGPDETRLLAAQRAADAGAGSPLPALVTAAAVAGLVGGGVVLRRRRGVRA